MASEFNGVGTTRRVLIAGLPSLTIAVAVLKPARALQPHRLADSAPRFFTEPEHAFVTAAVDRLLPDDENCAGRVAADVPRFIDLQRTGPW